MEMLVSSVPIPGSQIGSETDFNKRYGSLTYHKSTGMQPATTERVKLIGSCPRSLGLI